MKEKGQLLSIEEFQLFNKKKMREMENLSLEYHLNNCCGQDPLVDTKTDR